MAFREFAAKADIKINKEVSKNLEISGIVHSTDDKSILFENVAESENKVAVNTFASKDKVAAYLGCEVKDLVPKMINALENPSEPEVVTETDHQDLEVDLEKIPILTHTENDGGPYVSSGLVIVKDDELGQNVCFHRGMVFDKDKFTFRILDRNTMEIMKKNGGEVKAAYCIGCGAETLLAAAMAPPIGVNELTIANTIQPIKVVKAKGFDALLPADAEVIMEGTLSMNDRNNEGPFVDLTETPDIVRQEPTFTVEKIYVRPNYIWHGLLPGGFEHKVLMGMPREPTVFQEVKKAGIDIVDVSVNPGGCSWLHVLIKINKKSDEDGKNAIDAGMLGHTSAKHFYVVDSDVDIYNPYEVEWAMSTRFQADKDLYTFPGEKGSSLDPSGDPETRKTCKAGFDLTMPLDKIKEMTKQPFPDYKLEDYLG